MTIRNRIARGYMLVLGLALTGCTTGLIVGNHLQKRALAAQELAIAERKLLTDLQVKILYNRPTKQLSPYLNDAAAFQVETQAFLDRITAIGELLETHETVYASERKLKGHRQYFGAEHQQLHQQLTDYQATLSAFYDRTQTFRVSVNRLEDTPDRLPEAQQLLIEFVQGQEFATFVQFPTQLAIFVEQAEQRELAAALTLKEVFVLETYIIFGSLILSSIIATAMAIYTSRAIASPIQAVTAIAHQLTQEGNFNLQIPVKGSDEVSILAKAFNHLIQQVQQLLGQLNQKNIDLEAALQKLNQQQMQLIQAEKMSGLGKLVAGIAHEINNPVNFIHGNLSPMQAHIDDLISFVHCYQQHYGEPDDALVEETEDIDIDFIQQDTIKTLSSMRAGTERIRQIVLSLRNFSHMDQSEFKAVNIHEGIDNTLLMLQHRLGKTRSRPAIQIKKDYDPLPAVECAVGHLNQVFLNILSNAIEAIETRYNKTAASKNTQMTVVPAPQITIRTSMLASDWVQVEIADNGPGIPEAVQSKIFEPFFTTKPIGKGTGMGLALSYQIITERHGGKLECFSTPGQGTSIILKISQRIKPSTRSEPGQSD